MLSIGLMSGTSMDGIDAALLETDGTAQVLKDCGNIFLPYDPQFKILIKSLEYAVKTNLGDLKKAKSYYFESIYHYLSSIIDAPTHIDETIQQLLKYLYGSNKQKQISFDDVILLSTRLHSEAVIKLLETYGFNHRQVNIIGYHGQTLFHQPAKGVSITVGDGQYLADLLGITVINDFRARDIAAGGQGAPFAPLYHQALATRDGKIPVAVINCGGISNITFINSDDELDLIGFDTGPGNALLDTLIRQRTQGRECMDLDGQYGSKGRCHETVLKVLYEKSIPQSGINYFQRSNPKSLDYNDLVLIPELDALTLEDACATLAAFTADTIVNSLELVDFSLPSLWILAGGGWKNPVIRKEFEIRLLKKIKEPPNIMSADEAGWNTQAMEAQIFAYFAVRSMQNKVLSVPGTTGVSTAVTGGKTYIPKMLQDHTL